MRNHGFEEIGPHVRDGAHQHAAGAAALNRDAIFRSVFVVDEMFGARDEIRESIYLVHHAPGVAPRFAEFAAAANVRDDKDDAAIEQRETTG